MDGCFLKILPPLFHTYFEGSSLAWITSMEIFPAAPGWLCGEFRDELYAEKVPSEGVYRFR